MFGSCHSSKHQSAKGHHVGYWRQCRSYGGYPIASDDGRDSVLSLAISLPIANAIIEMRCRCYLGLENEHQFGGLDQLFSELIYDRRLRSTEQSY
jgi:hypothetical protein